MRNKSAETTVLASLKDNRFGIILRNANSIKFAVEIAGNLLRSLRKSLIIDKKELFINPLISVIDDGGNYLSGKQILKDANLTLAAIKDEAAASIKVFSPEIRQKAKYRLELTSALPSALKNQEFLVYYQPIISLVTGKLFGFEALVRWQHGETLVSPVQFIPICEETGLIVPLGLRLMETACRQTRIWQKKYSEHRDLKISVNLSAKQFGDRNLIEDVKNVLSKTGLNGRDLKLEITESLFINDFESVTRVLESLSKLKIRFSIDDFGTGYSSLSYLQNIPAHTLKLDRAFVSDIEQEKNKAIALAVVSLGHLMDMDIIAEGIETKSQLEILRSLKCEYGQGYYFERPLPESEVEEYLSQFSPIETFMYS